MDRLSQMAPPQPTHAPGGGGALIEIWQLESASPTKQKMVPHSAVYVDSRRWLCEDAFERDRRVVAAMQTAFLYGLHHCPEVYEARELFEPGIVAGLVAEGLWMHHGEEELPVRMHILSKQEMERAILGNGALRLRVLLPDTHPSAQRAMIPVWWLFMLHNVTGMSAHYLGIVDEHGFRPASELEQSVGRGSDDQGAAEAPLRIPVQPVQQPEPVGAEATFTFSNLLDSDPGFWNGIGTLLDDLDDLP